MTERVSLSDITTENLYHCNKCGLCLQACPVYKELLVESASPRGKVQLCKHVLEGDMDLSEKTNAILFSQCLLCGSCTVACPSGVHQDVLFSGLRWRATQHYGIDWSKKLLFKTLSTPWIMHGSTWFARWARKIFGGSWIESKIKLGNLPMDGIPPFNAKPFNGEVTEIVKPDGTPKARVLYFHGCATNYVFGDIGRAVVTVLNRMGVEVVIPRDQGCCGLPIFLSGDRATSLKCIQETLKLFAREDVDAVVVDCATCGSALKKEYPQILRELRDLGEDIEEKLVKDAELLASKTVDVSEFIGDHMDWLPALSATDGSRIRVTYHDPCHLLKGQSVGLQPRRILRALPNVDFIEMGGPDTCCGGGGEFQIECPETSAAITNRKIRNIHRSGAGIVATGCPGCNVTIRSHMDKNKEIKVFHTAQLVAMALENHDLVS
ncbi:MAG TPA: (Fe-S)-binding protein [Syntrophales bacterium]|nr:(Fe-S)-binding protein [Syntrophales bacterium]